MSEVAPGCVLRTGDPVPSLSLPVLSGVPWLRHAVTTRLGGASTGRYASLNLGLSGGDERETVLRNRATAMQLLGLDGLPVSARQVHGVHGVLVEHGDEPGALPAVADMLFTMQPGLALLLQSADCGLLLAVDPAHRTVAVAHAGWRGTAAGAGRALVEGMARWFGSRPGDLLVGISPTIGACCYEVGDDVADAVAGAVPPGARHPVVRKNTGRPHLDLVSALCSQVAEAGVPAEQIQAAGLCTGCRTDLFYSHRLEGEPTGRFGALIAIAP